MRIDRQQVLELLRSKGDDAKVEQAARELPDELDTDDHGNVLSTLVWHHRRSSPRWAGARWAG